MPSLIVFAAGILVTLGMALVCLLAFLGWRLYSKMDAFMTKDEGRMTLLNGAILKLGSEAQTMRGTVGELYSIVKGASDGSVHRSEDNWNAEYQDSVRRYIEAGYDPDIATREATRNMEALIAARVA